jgi:hypothetical protein
MGWIWEMVKEYLQVNFRLPTDLKEKIAQEADLNGNSLTTEIVERLRNSFEYDKLVIENHELHEQLINSESEKLDILFEKYDKLIDKQEEILKELKKG